MRSFRMLVENYGANTTLEQHVKIKYLILRVAIGLLAATTAAFLRL